MRGTTPKLIFELPFEPSCVAVAYITIVQNGSTVIEKTLEDCTIEGNDLWVRLTQEETLSLDEMFNVKIQLRGRTIYGEAFKSDVYTTTLDELLKEGVI